MESWYGGCESHRFHHIPNFGHFWGPCVSVPSFGTWIPRVGVSEILRPTATACCSQNVPRSLLRIPGPPAGTLDGDFGRTGNALERLAFVVVTLGSHVRLGLVTGLKHLSDGKNLISLL